MDKLKVALLLDSLKIPAWELLMLEKIIKSDYAVIQLVALNTTDNRMSKKWGNIVFYLYERFDKRIFKPLPDALELKEANEILSGIPMIKVSFDSQTEVDCFRTEDVTKIKSFGIDIIINLGSRRLKGEILQAAKAGVWSYHLGDSDVNRGGPPGFWEVVLDWPETGSELKIESENSNDNNIIYHSWSMTDRLSLARNRNGYLWKTASFIPRKLYEFHRLKEKDVFKRSAALNRKTTFYSNPTYTIPANIKALRLIARQLLKILRHIIVKLFYIDQWSLMFNLNHDFPLCLANYKKIIPARGTYWADPQIIHRDGTYYIFIEEYVYREKKGHISLLGMDADGNIKNPVKLIEKKYHLSYPFVFEWKGIYYMVPETAENKTIELYECVEFPYKWKFKMNLMTHVEAYDTTLLYYGNKWWLFTCIIENQGAKFDELFLFFSDELFTESWKPHPLNPIVSDVKNARPAGRIFERGGKLYRPAQNCSKVYGFGFNINEVSVLNEVDYRESTVTTVKPNWDRKIQAIHTFNSDGALAMVDVFRKKNKFF